ncbi:hypothetical protein T484DRAFT_1959882 [Baffinella frigidus]|nr:hypothetical protein T484DRAFT_1959882 [Cryptophyta sp. CCMP2293]
MLKGPAQAGEWSRLAKASGGGRRPLSFMTNTSPFSSKSPQHGIFSSSFMPKNSPFPTSRSSSCRSKMNC